MSRRFHSKPSPPGWPIRVTPEITADELFADAVCEIYAPYDPYDQCLDILNSAPPRLPGLRQR